MKKRKRGSGQFGTIIENLIIPRQRQILNFGKVEGDIKHNIEILNKAGGQNISKAIEQLVSLVKQSNEIQELQRKECLDSLKLLSEEALKPKDTRLTQSILKTIIKYGWGSLNAISSISTVAGVNLTTIAEYFLNQE